METIREALARDSTTWGSEACGWSKGHAETVLGTAPLYVCLPPVTGGWKIAFAL